MGGVYYEEIKGGFFMRDKKIIVNWIQNPKYCKCTIKGKTSPLFDILPTTFVNTSNQSILTPKTLNYLRW